MIGVRPFESVALWNHNEGMYTAGTNKTPSALDQLLDPLANCWPPEVATQIVQLRPDPAVQRQIDDLAEKANEGTLTPEERLDYEAYVEGIDLIGILKAKARMVLAKHAS